MTGSAAADVHHVDWSQDARGPSAHAGTTIWPSATAGAARLVRVEIAPGERVASAVVRVTRERRLDAPSVERAPRPERIADLGAPASSAGGYPLWVLPETSVRGHRIATFAVATHRLDAGASHALERFSIEVTTAPGAPAPLARRVHHPRTDEADRKMIARLLDTAPLPPGAARGAGGPIDQPLDPIEYVIVTGDDLVDAFAELAELKTREGMRAVVTPMSWILQTYEGADPPARLRAYLRDLYLHRGLRYALLGGDTGVVPVRLAANFFQSTGAGARLTADAYFACLDGDWNADGDATLGEAPRPTTGAAGDDVDLAPEISVARVPAQTAAQAAAFVAKWKSYTGYDPATFRTDYQNRFLALAEVLFPSDWDPSDDPSAIVDDGSVIAEATLAFIPSSFERTRLYEYHDNPELEPPVLPELKETVIQEINSGYGIVDHVGHGFRTNMSVGDGKLVNTDADAFTNTNAYSLLYGVNCTSGAVRFDCIGEHLINNPTGGIVASISSTDLDYPAVSDVFKYEFFRLIFEEEITRLGDAHHLANLPHVPLATTGDNAYRWTIMALIALGDPAMEIWRGTPRFAEVDVAPVHELGGGEVQVTVTESGAPVEGATVCLSKSDAYAVGATDATGVATLAFAPAAPGTADVTVTKGSFVPNKTTTEIVATKNPALTVTALAFHEGTAGGGTGNGDGSPDAGETALMDVTVRNAGGGASQPGTLSLSVDTPYVTVTIATSDLPALGPGAEETLAGAFAIEVDRVLPGDVRRIVADALIRLSTPGGEWRHEQPFAVRQRILDLTASRHTITGDDGDGIFETGETMAISVTLTNHGDATAAGVVGLVGRAGTGHVLLDDTVALGDIAPGESVESPPFRLLSTGGGTTYALDFFASDVNRLAVLSRTLDGVAPAPPEMLVTNPSSGGITLSWPPVDAPDVRGYRVYRALDPGGPFAPLAGVVEGGSYVEDGTVQPLVPYSYRISTVDWSGNEGEPSASVTATTTPPVLEGWPAELPSGLSKGSPSVADLDGDGILEIIFGWANPMVLRANGSDYIDGDEEPLTVGIFSDVPGPDSQFWNSPAVADLDGDGVLEIVFAAWQVTDVAHLYVLDATGAVEPGWPQPAGLTPWSSAAVGDVDGVPGLEIFMSSGAGSGPNRGVLFGFHHDGTEIVDGDGDPGTVGFFHKSASDQARFMYGSPALADLTGDGLDEIVFLEKTSHATPTAATLYAFAGDGTVLPGFPYGVGDLAGTTSSPAIADLDGDGTPEIIITTENRLSVVRADGSDMPGWPIDLPAILPHESSVRDFLSSPAVGDVDRDGSLDVVIGWRDGTVHAWTGESATPLAGFPATLIAGSATYDLYLHSPVLGNVDEDPFPEILVSSGDGRLAAANHDGTPVTGFPLRTAGIINGSPLLWDIDGDGSVNLVVQSEAPLVEVFDLATVPFVPDEHPWPMFRHDARKSGDAGTPILPAVAPRPAEETGPAQAAAHLGTPRPNPLRGGRVRVPFEVPRGGGEVEVRVFDAGGRLVRVLADGSFPAGRFELAWDGRRATGEALPAGLYLLGVTIGERTFTRKITLLR